MMTQTRVIGFSLLAALIIVLVPLAKAAAFGNVIVALTYTVVFAIGIWLTAPKRSQRVQLVWAAGLSVVLVVVATTINALIVPGEEGGPILGLVVFGFYLGLPTLIFATLLSIALKPAIAR